MTSSISAANLGGVADVHRGSPVQELVTEKDEGGRNHSVSRDLPPPDLHGHNTIYLDSSISFETYRYWAERSREYEKHIPTNNAGIRQIGNMLIGKKVASEPVVLRPDANDQSSGSKVDMDEKEKPSDAATATATDGSVKLDGTTDKYGIPLAEWEQAQRATRTATWGAIFYLITTDILGPTNVPWAISQMGYGPGAVLYTVFGLLAWYSGMQLWKIFIGLDSTRYPMRNYGDLAFRIFGNWARVIVNALQSFQFFLNVVLLIESNGQGLGQMAMGPSGNGYICFLVAEVVFMLAGFLLGQIRTLQNLGWLANLAIWLNVVVIIMTMVVVHQYPPNYAASLAAYNTPQGPIVTSAYWPPGLTTVDHVNGLMNAVFAYGGATLFNELMAEMRRPYDFWKGFLIAEIFIFACYLIMGMVVYSAQGQFSFNPAYQGIPNSAYAFQTVGNAVSFISGLIAALLYGNIGVKVFYSAVMRDIFQAPPLHTRAGKLMWVGLIPIYWALAFVLAGAIPQISNLTSFVGALCILQFSYTFPPLLMVGYFCQNDAILPEEHFDPISGQAQRVDQGWTRWMRGYRKRFALNTFNLVYFVGALATAGLGLWASITSMHTSFTTTAITPFTCTNPAG